MFECQQTCWDGWGAACTVAALSHKKSCGEEGELANWPLAMTVETIITLATLFTGKQYFVSSALLWCLEFEGG